MKDARRVNAARAAHQEDWLHLPESQPAARAQNAHRYFTGRECSRGHIARRITSNASCELCGIELPIAQKRHWSLFERAARLTMVTGRLHYVAKSLVVVATTKAVVAAPHEVDRWFKAAAERSWDGPWMVPVFDQFGAGRLAECRR